MNELIPPFEWQRLAAPWTREFSSTIWIALMGFLATTSCGLVGCYLILRRMALVGDAISHSVLPGIVVAFLLTHSRGSGAMFLGALLAGVGTTILIEVIHKKSRIKQDAAIGIAFTTLFAIGVILISLFASKVDLDQECVLYGEIGLVAVTGETVTVMGQSVGPVAVVRMGLVAICTLALVLFFYKELLVSSFDPGLAASMGINATLVHYALMCWLSLVVVSAFESVGAILVIAMLILPGATGAMISDRLSVIMALSVVIAAISSTVGISLAAWLNCSTAAAMVVAASGLFLLSWLFGPRQGLWRRFLPPPTEPALDATAPPIS